MIPFGQVDETKSINTLKEEIKAMHIIYDSKIPEFKSKPHIGQKNDALKSKDIKKVRSHYKIMMGKIKEYFNTGGLKLGIIIDAQSYLNNQFGSSMSEIQNNLNAPNAAAVKMERDPKKKLENQNKRQINYKETYIRGGMAHAKREPIRNRIPSFTPHKTGKHRIPQIKPQTNTIRPETIKRPRNVAYTNIYFKTKK